MCFAVSICLKGCLELFHLFLVCSFKYWCSCLSGFIGVVITKTPLSNKYKELSQWVVLCVLTKVENIPFYTDNYVIVNSDVFSLYSHFIKCLIYSLKHTFIKLISYIAHFINLINYMVYSLDSIYTVCFIKIDRQVICLNTIL